MTELDAARGPAYYADDENSLLASASVLLRWRRTIVALGLLGAVLGLASGLLSSRVYKSSATFIPQGSEGSNAGLAAAASQFGIRVPAGSGAWGPAVYVEMLRSRALLEPIALDTIVVAEQGGRRVPLMELLEIDAPTLSRRLDLTVEELRGMISANEENRFGAVEVDVTSRWPSVSEALAERLLERVNEFNLQTRKSQAAAERQFVEIQAREAERALRDAEDRLQLFLQRNRSVGGSPELRFDQDRLQREVTLRQNLFTSWLQSREEARIREVRDTPVITVLEDPQLPFVGEARGTVRKAIFGGMLGGMIGVLIAFLSRWLVGARRTPSEEAQEFFQLVEEATPRFLKKVRR
jgi:uncharacterized protein involved in exopolysaccharide biosynthesis